jgi:alpha-beta hydrolase superfamily lysophospholipase
MNPSSQSVRIGDTDLCVHTWNVSKGDDDVAPQSPKSIAVIYHGFLAHGRYPTVRYAAERMAAAGHSVVSADFRGHGKSPGLKGFLPSVEELIEDAVGIAEYARSLLQPQESNAKIFLVGSSMGGAIALSVAERLGVDKVAGLVLLAPMLKLSVSDAARYLLWGLSGVVPTWEVIPSSSTSAETQYRDPVKRKECEDDELTIKVKSIRVGSASTCVQLASSVQEQFDKVTCPFLLLVADEDVVVNNQGSLDLFEKAASSDKTMKRYPALHGLLCEPSPLVDTIESEIIEWMESRKSV